MLDLVLLSRLQFAITAIYHFLFVPLTLGLIIILGIMESVYVMSGKQIWKDATKFWGKLFAINFAMGVATGIAMEFQFGTNWGYYSHYVGDIFGVPLAVEGLMAFFLESTFVGLFLFGWDKLSKGQHLAVTWITAFGASMSALWILIANAWMQNPVGATFNPDTMRMELTSIKEVIFNEVAQSKFVHTISAGYVTGAIFVMAISAYYLIKHRGTVNHITEIAKRSIIVASAFGLLSSLSVVVLGDESGYTAAQNQKMKLAAIEAMWETEKAPAGFNIFALPNQEKQENKAEIKIPYALGLIATRSFDQELPGLKELEKENEAKIRAGINEYLILKELRESKAEDPIASKLYLKDNYHNIGYALLLKKYRSDIENSSEEEIKKAANDTIPNISPLFFSFRVMVGLGMFFILLFSMSFYQFNMKRRFDKIWLLRLCLFSLPLPWIASELGWFIAEHGRQPWAIDGILPTRLGVSSLSAGQVLGSLIGFVVLYTILLIIDIYLMVKYVKMGPSVTTSDQQPKTTVTYA